MQREPQLMLMTTRCYLLGSLIQKYMVPFKIKRHSTNFPMAIAWVHQTFIISHQVYANTFLGSLSASSFIPLLCIIYCD